MSETVPEPSLADALAQLNPYADHRFHLAAETVVVATYLTIGPWEAAAKATELAEHFEEIYLRQYYTPSVEFDCS